MTSRLPAGTTTSWPEIDQSFRVVLTERKHRLHVNDDYGPLVPGGELARGKRRRAYQVDWQANPRIEFSDYLLSGDRLAIDIDGAANRLLGLSVATYLDKPEDKVTLNMRMGSLTDGTGFTEETTLEAAAKDIRVVIQNGGHRPMAR